MEIADRSANAAAMRPGNRMLRSGGPPKRPPQAADLMKEGAVDLMSNFDNDMKAIPIGEQTANSVRNRKAVNIRRWTRTGTEHFIIDSQVTFDLNDIETFDAKEIANDYLTHTRG